MNYISTTLSSPKEHVLAYNLWQLEGERNELERTQKQSSILFLKPNSDGWWKSPVIWAFAFSIMFLAHDAFASLLVELIVKAGN